MATLCSYGAAGEVTGSHHLLDVNGFKILLDCGLWQGSFRDEQRNYNEFEFDPRQLDAVVLSHAHIDHSGRLPLLVHRGYRGPIYTHVATRDLCVVMLKDAAHLHLKDIESENHKRERKGLKDLRPMYTLDDVDRCIQQIQVLDYEQLEVLSDAVSLKLSDAGHILGSAIVQLTLEESGKKKTLVFTGDLGQYDAPIMRDPTAITRADMVMMECTYGDRDHRAYQETLDQLGEILNADKSLRGNILIPAFAVGRSQELLYLFAKYYREWKLHRWQIFVDSPMAIEATEIYLRHRALYDEEARAMFGEGNAEKTLRRLLPNLHFMRTPDESQSINRMPTGAIIIAGSGMCTGGRIRHHLKHLVWRSTTQVVIIGYQAYGTTGRKLVDHEQYIRLWGEAIRVGATVHTLGGLSAHAGQTDLLRWLSGFNSAPKVLLVHGEPAALQALQLKLRQDKSIEAKIVEPGVCSEI